MKFVGTVLLLMAICRSNVCVGGDLHPLFVGPLPRRSNAHVSILPLRGGKQDGDGRQGCGIDGGAEGSGGTREPDLGMDSGGDGDGEEQEPVTLNGRFRKAVRDCNLTLAETFISEGAEVNLAERGTHSTVLITACFQNDLEMIDMLLSKGALPNLCDEMLMAPLHYAAAWGYDLVVERLMATGADPTLLNMEGLTPRDLAEKRGHLYCAELLDKWLEAG
uniref:Uncharacterized protein n=1 Tax=Hemiselmis andersenii TaxID=464988 RepID=A0A7S1GYN0_HEMAN|mmetsp:Transcript_29729/g.72844  ORF Transcript_29729/g.72844 Transcript_29729/m.72844 type:complete len:220 (+) Transcript_29729:19-678(+)